MQTLKSSDHIIDKINKELQDGIIPFSNIGQSILAMMNNIHTHIHNDKNLYPFEKYGGTCIQHAYENHEKIKTLLDNKGESKVLNVFMREKGRPLGHFTNYVKLDNKEYDFDRHLWTNQLLTIGGDPVERASYGIKDINPKVSSTSWEDGTYETTDGARKYTYNPHQVHKESFIENPFDHNALLNALQRIEFGDSFIFQGAFKKETDDKQYREQLNINPQKIISAKNPLESISFKSGNGSSYKEGNIPDTFIADFLRKFKTPLKEKEFIILLNELQETAKEFNKKNKIWN